MTMRQCTSRAWLRSASKWAGLAACMLIAALWLFALVAIAPDDRTSFHIPLWVPLLTAAILWVRWHLPRHPQEG